MDNTVPATRGQMQCMAVDSDTNMAGAQKVDLYQYMAFGGATPSYDVTMTQEGEDDTVMDVAHQFMITMNDMDVAELSGQPNTKAGIYNWMLNAHDMASEQDVSRSWKLRVVQEDYDGTNLQTVTAEDPDLTDMEVIDWADFISSKFDGVGTLVLADVSGGTAASLDLSDNIDKNATPMVPGSGMISGTLNEAVDSVADVDVFWVGALTPDSVLSVKVEGTFESPNAPGVFNDVRVMLHSFVPGAEKSVAEMGVMSEDMEGYDEYKGPDCNFYYLEVSGGEGSYDLSWSFTE